MNKLITSQNEILDISKKMILENGIASFNMRIIAKQCGISVGAIYNYFPSKSELIMATVENVWIEIFEPLNRTKVFNSFVDAVACMFETIKHGDLKYPGFFSVHSLHITSEDKLEGVQIMNAYFTKLKQKLVHVIENDKNVSEGIFHDELSMEIFIDYIFSLLISILLKKADCKPLLILIKNYLYSSH